MEQRQEQVQTDIFKFDIINKKTIIIKNKDFQSQL